MVSLDSHNSHFSGGFDLRYRLKITQEGKEEDLWYITHLSISPKQDVFAAGGPQGSIKLFQMDTLLYCGDFQAHNGRITGLNFCRMNQHCFWTTSSDTAVSFWDTREGYRTPVYRILSPNNCPFSACGLNCSDEIIAAATDPYGEDVCLYLWDTRKLGNKMLQSYMEVFTDSHNGEITQLWMHLGDVLGRLLRSQEVEIQFSPLQTHQMASGSTDGLICLFDIRKGSEDDCLDSVLNTCSSVSQLGYFGPSYSSLYCVTHIETLQLWDVPETTMTTEFKNPREENGTADRLDYFIDGIYHPLKNQLFFVGGTHSGRLHMFHEKDSKLESACPLMGGHTAIVRCLQWDHISETILTGGEDSIISCWKSKEAQSEKPGKATSCFADNLKLHGNKPYNKPSNRKS